MIPQTTSLKTKQNWQHALANAINSADELLALLGLSGQLAAIDKAQIRQFPVRVPRSYIKKMRYGDASDPLSLTRLLESMDIRLIR